MTNEHSGCIFCKIIADQAPGDVVYEDDTVVCIKDIKPASTHHYLIIPKRHIDNAKAMRGPDDEKTLDHMVQTLPPVAEKMGFDLSETRTGFHWPPFNSVNHLHLHIISPVQNIGFFGRMIFLPNSLWFASVDYVKSRLQSSS